MLWLRSRSDLSLTATCATSRNRVDVLWKNPLVPELPSTAETGFKGRDEPSAHYLFQSDIQTPSLSTVVEVLAPANEL